MPATHEKQLLSTAFDPGMLLQLACPACFKELSLADRHLICAGCHRAYPLIDDIPVLIIERAETITGRI